MLHFHDITVSATPSDFFTVYENKFVVCADTVIVFQFDTPTPLINFLGSYSGTIKGINVLHVPIECGYKKYKEACEELIKYVIFQRQDDIVFDNLCFMNEQAEFHKAAQEACEANQKKISKNSYELFPKSDKACFNTGIKGIHFTISFPDDYNRAWFGDRPIYENPIDKIPVSAPDPSDGTYYELDEEATMQNDGIPQYNRLWVHEKYTLPMAKWYTQHMGSDSSFTSAMQEASGQIVIEHLVRPDEYMVVVE